MVRWQVIKDGVPVEVCNSLAEAVQVYEKLDADEIRSIKTDDSESCGSD